MSQSNKRARELARAKEERRQARYEAAQARKRRRQRIIIFTLVGVLVLGTTGGVLISMLIGDDGDSVAEAVPPAVDTDQDPVGDDGKQVVAGCRDAGEMEQSPLSFDAPGDGLAGATQATMTLQTNCGDIVIQTVPEAAPETVNSMTFLAQSDFFNNTLCHRLTTEGIYVLQCGDPTATGSGGPGYSVPDENLPAEGANNYPAGTVAMANAGPGTAGSQFFIVYQDTTLPANYTVWGTVTSGLDIVQAIAGAGTTNGSTDGAPNQAVMIERAPVTTG